MAKDGRIPPGRFATGTEGVKQEGPGPIHVWHPVPSRTTDTERESLGYIAEGLFQLKAQVADMARYIENHSRLVDEYRTQSLAADTETSITVPAQWDLVPEKIESIIIVGPAGNVTVQLGDRTWALTIPASGILVIAPIAMLLGRNDTRSITGPAGDYNLELMGYADERFTA